MIDLCQFYGGRAGRQAGGRAGGRAGPCGCVRVCPFEYASVCAQHWLGQLRWLGDGWLTQTHLRKGSHTNDNEARSANAHQHARTRTCANVGCGWSARAYTLPLTRTRIDLPESAGPGRRRSGPVSRIRARAERLPPRRPPRRYMVSTALAPAHAPAVQCGSSEWRRRRGPFQGRAGARRRRRAAGAAAAPTRARGLLPAPPRLRRCPAALPRDRWPPHR
jgi:hypothetical protein